MLGWRKELQTEEGACRKMSGLKMQDVIAGCEQSGGVGTHGGCREWPEMRAERRGRAYCGKQLACCVQEFSCD